MWTWLTWRGLTLFSASNFWQVLHVLELYSDVQEVSAGEQSCRKRMLLLKLLTGSCVSPPLSWAIQSIAFLICHKHMLTDAVNGHTMHPLYELCSNMFFAHLQQIKFPSKWISSLAAFWGRATLFSLIFILFPRTNDLLYSTVCITLHCPFLLFSPLFVFFFPLLLLNLGQAMESNYTVRMVYSDLLKALNAICFALLCVPQGNWVLTPKWDRVSAHCSMLDPESHLRSGQRKFPLAEQNRSSL